MFDINPEIRVADLLTVGSILLATATLLSTWVKDRRLRQREYADRVRHAAGRSLVALERWTELFHRLFSLVQPLITDADALIVKEQNAVATRDAFWRHLVAAYASVLDDLAKEGLEGAYVDLYAFDPAVYAQYSAAISGLKDAGQIAYSNLLHDTQATIWP